MTAEECLLRSLFAVVSSDCHVRNVRAWTTGPGMLLSETNLADQIWTLHSSDGPLVRSCILFTVHLKPRSLCLDEPICKAILSRHLNPGYQQRPCAPAMVFIMNHVIAPTTEGNMFAGASATNCFLGDRRPTTRMATQPLAYMRDHARAARQSRAADCESYPNLVSSPETQLGELVAVVFINLHWSPPSSGSDIAAPIVERVLM